MYYYIVSLLSPIESTMPRLVHGAINASSNLVSGVYKFIFLRTRSNLDSWTYVEGKYSLDVFFFGIDTGTPSIVSEDVELLISFLALCRIHDDSLF